MCTETEEIVGDYIDKALPIVEKIVGYEDWVKMEYDKRYKLALETAKFLYRINKDINDKESLTSNHDEIHNVLGSLENILTTLSDDLSKLLYK